MLNTHTHGNDEPTVQRDIAKLVHPVHSGMAMAPNSSTTVRKKRPKLPNVAGQIPIHGEHPHVWPTRLTLAVQEHTPIDYRHSAGCSRACYSCYIPLHPHFGVSEKRRLLKALPKQRNTSQTHHHPQLMHNK